MLLDIPTGVIAAALADGRRRVFFGVTDDALRPGEVAAVDAMARRREGGRGREMSTSLVSRQTVRVRAMRCL